MKYRVYGIMSAIVLVGEYKADTEQAAKDMADEDFNAKWNPALCWSCSGEIELGDVYEIQVEAIEEETK